MNKPIHPAVAEHVMEENERLREVLRCIADLPMDRCSTENDYRLSAAKAIALGALSQQAEPCQDCDNFGDVHGPDGEYIGRCKCGKAEPARAQDEREAPEVVAVLYKSGDVLTAEECGIALEVCAKVETPLMTVAQHERIVAALARPAQTEQQPVAWLPYLSDGADGVTGHYAIARKNPAGYREVWNLRRHHWAAFSDEVLTMDEALAILKKLEMPTAPIAQTAPQPEQSGLVAAVTVLERALDFIQGNNDFDHRDMLERCECYSCVTADITDALAALAAQGGER